VFASIIMTNAARDEMLHYLRRTTLATGFFLKSRAAARDLYTIEAFEGWNDEPVVLTCSRGLTGYSDPSLPLGISEKLEKTWFISHT
jgi:hypothetical protein